MIMSKLKAFMFLIMCVWTLVSCEPSSNILASESVREGKILCNPFNIQGFHGVLSIHSSQNNFSYEGNTSILSFYDVPDAFKTQKNTYIQLYAFNYSNNQRSSNRKALEIDVFNLRSNNRSDIITYIDHNFIQAKNYELNKFFADHAFIIKDTAGWDALFIGLFNEHDNATLKATILIPPFEANPYIYSENNAGNQSLINLHPFNNLKTSIDRASDDVFLSKAQTACHENPI